MKSLFLMVPLMDFGGQERFVATLSSILKEDYNIEIIVFDAYKIGYEVDAPIIELPKPKKNNALSRLLNLVKKYAYMKKLYAKYNPVACISFGNGANRFNILTKKKNAKAIISVRGFEAAKKYTESWIEKIVLKRATNVVCVSNALRELLRCTYNNEKFVTIYNAYDVDAIEKSSECSKKPISIGSVHLISAGRVTDVKGFWHLIRVIYELRRRGIGAELDVFGADPENEVKNLNSFSEYLGVDEYVHFRGNTDRIYEEIGKRDIYVLSSISEGFPNALVEAMACGLPVIADDCVSGPREILDYNQSGEITSYVLTRYGILTPKLNGTKVTNSNQVEDAEMHIADAIQLLIEKPELYNELSKQGRIRANDFSYEACRKQYCDLISK